MGFNESSKIERSLSRAWATAGWEIFRIRAALGNATHIRHGNEISTLFESNINHIYIVLNKI